MLQLMKYFQVISGTGGIKCSLHIPFRLHINHHQLTPHSRLLLEAFTNVDHESDLSSSCFILNDENICKSIHLKKNFILAFYRIFSSRNCDISALPTSSFGEHKRCVRYLRPLTLSTTLL